MNPCGPCETKESLRKYAEDRLELPMPLHDFQWEGVSFLCRSESALLADEMGLGKTVQTSVALALLLARNSDVSRALIVAPASLVTNWMSELATWAPSLTVRRVRGNAREREAFYLLPIQVLVCSYEQIRKDGLDRVPARCFDIVILDEAQRIKNFQSVTSFACRLLPRRWSWALSATPLENHMDDVLSVLKFLDPSIGDLTDRQVAEHLEAMMLRRRKRDVRRELPPIIQQDLRLGLTEAQRHRYDDVWINRYSEVGQEARPDVATALLAVITRLKIICNHDMEANASSKLQALLQVCDSAGKGARILVFSQFVRTLEWVSDRLPIRCGLLTGAMSDDERQRAMERFEHNETPRVLLVSLRAGGVGLNLGAATHVVAFDRWWNPAVEAQAIYRAHRFERDSPLHVIRFLVVGSIEERIASILRTKEDLFRRVVEGREASQPRLTVPELAKILELSASAIAPRRRGKT